ncbi:uncharacterized protein LOC134667752 [Cydia fagiglandana]|uniref:uncharacterized protein LOC134667752 n=1 Tax=Cydia fagiglandana TaxID=1458189 RepID=UPI002FEDF650
MTDIKIKERLYLSKADDIYVDHHQLMQHQVDALRMLYAQFKKKTGGVILNDPSGYGKTVVAVLFLQALRQILPSPALVLCRAGELQHWRHHFHTWATTEEGLQRTTGGVILNDPSGYGKTVVAVLFLQALRQILPSPALVLCRAGELQHWRHHFHTWATTEDVIFESSNPYVKKSIFVNTRQQLPSLCRRTWSVVVVDDDLPKELQADFKIYLTNEDMKENLITFASIYQWMFPKGPEFDIKQVTGHKNGPADFDKKAYLLDFIFEGIVFRSKNFTPFKKPETQAPPAPIVIEPPRISRKNKDATGTKIKRSKARIEAESNHAAKIPRTEPTERNSTITSKDYYRDKEMDVESFIKNEKPITGEGVEEFMDFQAMIKSDTENLKDIVRNERLNGEVPITEENTDVCTADYQNAINDIVNNENDKSIEESYGNIDVRVTESDSATGKANNGVNVSTENDADVVSVSNSKIEVPNLEENKDETIQVVNNEKKKDLETKLTELEEKTLNKFKGSLLDSIF